MAAPGCAKRPDPLRALLRVYAVAGLATLAAAALFAVLAATHAAALAAAALLAATAALLAATAALLAAAAALLAPTTLLAAAALLTTATLLAAAALLTTALLAATTLLAAALALALHATALVLLTLVVATHYCFSDVQADCLTKGDVASAVPSRHAYMRVRAGRVRYAFSRRIVRRQSRWHIESPTPVKNALRLTCGRICKRRETHADATAATIACRAMVESAAVLRSGEIARE